ncbi:MAG: T9SS type A sorting domain-containing protein [bacterium]|nr:T9SS type A sorting domain-containing protein [bacterium]
MYFGGADGAESFIEFEASTQLAEGSSGLTPSLRGFTVQAGDVNGDGYADFMRTLCIWYDDHCHLYPYLFLGGPSVFDTLADWSGDLTVIEFITNVGDYNGDGKDDYTSRPLSAQYFGLYLGGVPPLSQIPEWEHVPNRAHMGFGDVNGDGFSDFGMSYFIGSQDLSRMDIFLGSAEGDSIPLVYQYGPGEPGIEGFGRIVGDINGDNFDDIISYFTAFEIGARKYVYFGSESLDFERDDEFIWGNGNAAPLYVTPLGDINDDGFDDYAHYYDYQQPPIDHIEVWLGGSPLPRSPAWVLDGPLDGMNYPYRIGEAGDFNGDGIDDWFFSAYHGLEARGRIIVVAGDRDFGLAVNDHSPIVPQEFSLSIYPNPFNSTLSISLDVPLHQEVTLSLYDLLGREVDVVYRGGSLRIRFLMLRLRRWRVGFIF